MGCSGGGRAAGAAIRRRAPAEQQVGRLNALVRAVATSPAGQIERADGIQRLHRRQLPGRRPCHWVSSVRGGQLSPRQAVHCARLTESTGSACTVSSSTGPPAPPPAAPQRCSRGGHRGLQAEKARHLRRITGRRSPPARPAPISATSSEVAAGTRPAAPAGRGAGSTWPRSLTAAARHARDDQRAGHEAEAARKARAPGCRRPPGFRLVLHGEASTAIASRAAPGWLRAGELDQQHEGRDRQGRAKEVGQPEARHRAAEWRSTASRVPMR